MIKLNNKNITYVALADSNNSLKAPKEIWYADSNNSVKLVYRRKDALIEGEDYEKYHWLVSNSEDNKTPYIDTLLLPNLNQNISFSFKVINSITNGGEPGVYGVLVPTSWNKCVIRCYKNTSYNYIILEYNNNNNDFPNRENMIIKTEFSEGKEYDCSLSINSSTTASGVINNESKELVANSNVSFVLNPQPTHKLFIQETTPTWSFNSVGFKKFNITNLISLVPCKLLKPVPKWLDANGIRRQVGECGMIDLVSGKFYGNVNSVGTFTVENYYERKEWLVGDGSAVINTNIDDITNLTELYCYFYSDNPSNNERIFGRDGNSRIVLRYVSANNLEFFTSPSNNPSYITLGFNTEGYFYADFTANQASTSLSSPTNFIGNSDKIGNLGTIHLFGDKVASGPTSIVSAKIKSFRAAPFIDLIPCTLTMDLPASMDANNISRTKGTSGMWDLVSDRFYGNVANSGTFKAVNLAEGVDYEVHQWLVGDDAYFIIPVNPYQESLYVKFHPTSSESNHEFWSGFYNIPQNSTIEIRGLIGGSNELGIRFGIRENNAATATVIYKTGLDYLSDFSIEIQYSEDNKVNYTFNGTSGTATPIIDSRANKDVSVAFKTTWCRFAMVTTDRLNLIPVKLLRSIPSKYDANGIARQAGECGMYDTVNDVFYGNVASSGTFSVSDDE